jgi:hypothetical protein
MPRPELDIGQRFRDGLHWFTELIVPDQRQVEMESRKVLTVLFPRTIPARIAST